MNGFEQVLDTTHEAFRDALSRSDSTIEAVWQRLIEGRWQLDRPTELRLMEPGLRAAFAYAFGVTVNRFEYVRPKDFYLGAQLPAWMPLHAADMIARSLSLTVAEALDTRAFAKRLEASRPAGIDASALASEPGIAGFDSPEFHAAVWQSLVGTLGPAGNCASQLLVATCREYLLRLKARDAASARQMAHLLESYFHLFPLGFHEKDRRTLVVLCGD